jgi:hypothetical protein
VQLLVTPLVPPEAAAHAVAALPARPRVILHAHSACGVRHAACGDGDRAAKLGTAPLAKESVAVRQQQHGHQHLHSRQDALAASPWASKLALATIMTLVVCARAVAQAAATAVTLPLVPVSHQPQYGQRGRRAAQQRACGFCTHWRA